MAHKIRVCNCRLSKPRCISVTGMSFSVATTAFESQFAAIRQSFSRPASMTEIRARAKKHMEVEEDKEDRLQAEKELQVMGKRSP
ncbi:hypothetical protein CR513_38015, partial [Mucuna pruriens]